VAIGSVTAPNTAFKDEQRGPIGRWESDFSPTELATLEGLIGGTLQQLSYPLSTKNSTTRRSNLATMRSWYRLYFESKQYIKTKHPGGEVVRDPRFVLGLALRGRIDAWRSLGGREPSGRISHVAI